MNKQWMAGFFDGEGSLHISKSGKRSGPLLRCSICQANPVIMFEIHRKYGGTISVWKSKVNDKSVTKLEMRNTILVRNFLEDIYPYLRLKDLEAECALSFLDLPWRQSERGGARKKLTDDQKHTDAMFATELKYLKPRHWPDYSMMESKEDIVDYAFEKVCELHPE